MDEEEDSPRRHVLEPFLPRLLDHLTAMMCKSKEESGQPGKYFYFATQPHPSRRQETQSVVQCAAVIDSLAYCRAHIGRCPGHCNIVAAPPVLEGWPAYAYPQRYHAHTDRPCTCRQIMHIHMRQCFDDISYIIGVS
jgi:hypothetical protein